MKERPILFSAPMVTAILEGRKTQTRRVVKPQPDRSQHVALQWEFAVRGGGALLYPNARAAVLAMCPYGVAGDRLWVRETWRAKPYSLDRQHPAVEYRASMKYEGTTPNGKALDALIEKRAPWKPSIYMSRWASRINLEITGVRVERLQDIGVDSILAEGCCHASVCGGEREVLREAHWRPLWESINGAESWAANPWVWVIEFKKAA